MPNLSEPERSSRRRLRVAIVGPGRVGRAIGRRWGEAGVSLLGYVGRSEAAGAAAAAFAGRGRALACGDLAAAHVVVFAVGDTELPAAIAGAAAAAGAGARLWLHTSGRHGLAVLAPLAGPGARLASLHPVVPFPDAETGLRGLRGRAAVITGEARALRLTTRLALWLGMTPLIGADGDRTLYHAACALAANGLTALRGAADAALAASGVLEEAGGAVLLDQLMAAALDACRRQGARDALSGPVARGDAATVAAHRAALLRAAPATDDLYRAAMLAALRLVEARDLDAGAVADLRRALGAADD